MSRGKGFPYREKKKPAPQRDWCPYVCPGVDGESGSKYKRIRVRCPLCKRRMFARVGVCCDMACTVTYHVPKHKTR